jgi:5-methyltetrahydrofolate--homocysteine methyltransferase
LPEKGLLKSFAEKLKEDGVLLADGAWGTELIKKGLRPGDCPEALNLEHPEIVRGVARAYRKAGADIILTNTFGASTFMLKRKGLEKKVKEINSAGAELSAREAAGGYVLGSIGPTGEFLSPLGALSEEEMAASFLLQAEGLLEGGADGFIIETMSDINEASCALSAVREVCSLPVAISMTFEKGARGFATIMGQTPADVVGEFAGKADLIGANCGAGIVQMLEVVELFKPFKNIWIKPNAGSPEIKDGEVFYRQSAAEMAGYVSQLRKAGAKVIGGCCGTTPEFIKEFSAVLRGGL